MAKFDNPLNNLKVASPCSQDWNAMVGNERKRYCGECKLNVYNLSGMSRTEAENLIINAEGRLCVRFYKRADGSVITQDCPVGWARVKQHTKALVTAFASLIFSFISAVGLVAVYNKFYATENVVMGDVAVYQNSNTEPEQEDYPFTMGAVTPEPQNNEMVGRIAVNKKR